MSSFVKASGNIMPNSADPGEEFPFLHTITVVDRVVSVDKPELIQNNIKTETVTLNLDSEWDGLSAVINIGNYKPTALLWNGSPVVIPAELMTNVGSLDVSVVGYNENGNIRAVTKEARDVFNVVASGYVDNDDIEIDPTTFVGQLVEAANKANTAAENANNAAQQIGDISEAVSNSSESAEAAKTSETNAASSADSARESASAASASALAAKTSETNAAASATAAQQAVDGFGLEVGTTTTGNPGTDAAVSITKQGTKYQADFTIPRGDVGPAGVNENVPLGSTSGIVAQATDAYPTLPRKVQVRGRTIENLWPVQNGTIAGITVSTDDSGLISFSGTSTVTDGHSIESNIDHSFAVGEKYTLLANNIPTGIRLIGIRFYNQKSVVQTFTTTSSEAYSITVPDIEFDRVTSLIGVPTSTTNNGVVNGTMRIMLVASETEPDSSLFVPSGVNTVEPEKLTVLGENLLDLSFISSSSNAKVSGDEVIFKVDVDGLNDAYTWNDVTNDPYNGDTKYLIPVIPNSRLHFKAETSEPIASSTLFAFYGSAYNLVKRSIKPNVSGNIQSLDFDVPATAAFISVRLGVREATQDATITMRNICLSYTDIEYVPPEKIETDLPSDISLADGDTLTIDRDGTTQILHAEGEPTVLENVTLPELPAPTFNIYTVGGYIQPVVNVDYEQDVNLALDREIPHDGTLIGNGTKNSPLGVGDLSSKYTLTTTTTALDTRVQALEAKPSGLSIIDFEWAEVDFNNLINNGIYLFNCQPLNCPNGMQWNSGQVLVMKSYQCITQILTSRPFGDVFLNIRIGNNTGQEIIWEEWQSYIDKNTYDTLIARVTALESLEARVQTLETKLSNQ